MKQINFYLISRENINIIVIIFNSFVILKLILRVYSFILKKILKYIQIYIFTNIINVIRILFHEKNALILII